MRQSSGGCVRGGKKPTARSIKQDFETFFESFKIRTAWRKDFFRHGWPLVRCGLQAWQKNTRAAASKLQRACFDYAPASGGVPPGLLPPRGRRRRRRWGVSPAGALSPSGRGFFSWRGLSAFRSFSGFSAFWGFSAGFSAGFCPSGRSPWACGGGAGCAGAQLPAPAAARAFPP